MTMPRRSLPSTKKAWWLWIATGSLVVWGLIAPLPVQVRNNPSENRGDLEMYRIVTERVRAGESYYSVLAEELPARHYAVRPFFNWRLPTLAYFNAMVPDSRWSVVVLAALGLATVPIWLFVLGIREPPAAIVAVIPLMATAVIFTVPKGHLFHEIWAGGLISLSLGCWAIGRPALSVGAGTAALSIRELALPFVLIMGAMAWREGRRREAAAWLAVVAAFAGGLGLHFSAISRVVPADGLTNSWTAFGGWPFVLAAAKSSPLAIFAPKWLLACVVPLTLAGAVRWRDPVGHRLAAVLGAYALFFSMAGRPDNWYWGMTICSLLPLGLFGFRARASASGRPGWNHAG